MFAPTTRPAGLQVKFYIHRAFTRIGDTKIIEDSNKITRAKEQRDQLPNLAEPMMVWHALRGVPSIIASISRRVA